MIGNYLKHALRYILKYKVFSLINIGGLIISLLSCAIILNFVLYEYSYDKIESREGEIYRVNLLRKKTDQRHAAIGPPMGPALQSDFAEVEKAVRLRHADNILVSLGNDEYYETKVFYADSGFFEFFPCQFVELAKPNPIDEINTVVLSQSLAQKYFGNESALGKTIRIDNQKDFKVTGVVKKSKTPQHLQFDMIISFSSFEVPYGYPVTLDTWGWTSFPTYVRLAEQTELSAFNEKLSGFIARHMGEEVSENISLEAQAIQDIHLNSENISERDGTAPKGSKNQIRILIIVALAILGLSIFNFVNLSTALSIKRIKEVGIRKVLGANRLSIFRQFVFESIVLVLIATLVAVTLFLLLGEQFNQIFEAPLFIKYYLLEYWYLVVLFSITLGLLSGFYPATIIARFSASETLSSASLKVSSPSGVKSILVGLQYFITIGLIIGSITVGRQMHYLSQKDLGYENENVIVLKVDGASLTQNYEMIRQKLLQNASVKNVTSTGNMFDGQNGSVPVYLKENREESYRISLLSANYDFLETMEIPLLSGRDFSAKYANDSTSFIINKAAADMLQIKTDDLGKEIVLNDVWEGQLIGITENFHFASLHENIQPIILFFPRSFDDRIFIRLNNDDYQLAINTIKADFSEVFPNLPFDYKFLKEHVSGLYRSDKLFANSIYFFSAIALILACLGLYAIISFQIETRQKELSIKKILGASDWKIAFSLIKQFVLFIAIAGILAIPLSVVSVQKWLEGFAYRISINAFDVIIAIVIIVSITLLSLSHKLFKAINTSPLKYIKDN
jgi:putative ABC transport system permease protein